MADEPGAKKGILKRFLSIGDGIGKYLFVGGLLVVPALGAASYLSMASYAASVGATTASGAAVSTTFASVAAPGTVGGTLTGIYNLFAQPDIVGCVFKGLAGILSSGFDLVASPVLAAFDPAVTATEAIATSWNSPTPAMDWFFKPA